jgi:hypothetical protein
MADRFGDFVAADVTGTPPMNRALDAQRLHERERPPRNALSSLAIGNAFATADDPGAKTRG